MAETDDTLYFQYLKAFAVVHGGGQLAPSELSVAGNVDIALGLALGVEDGKNRRELRSQSDVLQAIKAMRGHS